MYDNEGENYPEQIISVPVNVDVSWSNGDVTRQAVEQVVELVYADMKSKIQNAVSAKLDEMVNAALTEVLEREVTPTDRWGNTKGKPQSINALLQQSAEE